MILYVSLLGMILSTGSAWRSLPPAEGPVQPDTLKVWNIAADRISSDPLGQYYIVQAGSLVRYGPRGDSACSWSEPQTGRITMIDTGDPLRILVYQKDFNLVRFLNNRLAPLSGPIRLDDLGLPSPLALAVSRQGGFWVLDGSTFRIRYIDRQQKTTLESEPLNLPSGSDPAGYRMIENGDRIFLHIPGKEIQVFDLFANLIRRIPARALSFNVYGNLILLVYPDKIDLWKDPVTPEETLFVFPGADIREAFLYQNKLLIRTSGQVILLTR